MMHSNLLKCVLFKLGLCGGFVFTSPGHLTRGGHAAYNCATPYSFIFYFLHCLDIMLIDIHLIMFRCGRLLQNLL